LIKHRSFVGLDVHARSIEGCVIDDESGVITHRKLPATSPDIVGWVLSLPDPQIVTYEAGPTGFSLARQLDAAGIECRVAAPSKLQRPVGDRVKTDSRDAEHLAKLLRLDQIVAVTVPSAETETVRDVVRAREDTRQILMGNRHQLSKLLLRHGLVYDGGQAWTAKHDRWLREHRNYGDASFTTAFDAYYEATIQTVARRDRLDTVIEELAATSSFAPMVARLGCLRGIGALTGLALAVEIGDWHRFTGKTIGSFVGLVPTEYSSGQSRSQGGITKTGNAHARRMLVEAGWHHRRDYRPSRQSVLHARWEKAPAPARLRGQEGNLRLHNQWVAFTARKKRPVVANTAIARELAGWCWSLAVMDN
jgi:transposase